MSAEFFSPAEPEAARAHFEDAGHVGLTGLVDPTMAEQIILEAERMAYRPMPRNGSGEQVTILRPRNPGDQEPELAAFIEGIYRGAELLGRDLRAGRREEARKLLLGMDPETRGMPHYDKPDTVDIGGVTNLIGGSYLWFEDGANYRLEPGRVVYHDHDRHLFHGGYTGPGDQRVGFVVTKVTKSGKLSARRKIELDAKTTAEPPQIPDGIDMPGR